MQFWAGAFTVTINACILNLPVMRYFRYLLKRTHRVLRPTDEPVENRNQINNLAQSGSSQITDSELSYQETRGDYRPLLLERVKTTPLR